MKNKIQVRFTIFRAFKELLIEIKNDLKLLFSKSGRSQIIKERHHLHFLYSSAIASVLQTISLLVGNTSFWMIITIGFIFVGACNAIREGIIAYRTQKREGYSNFDWRDVRYGVYGGILTCTLIWIIGIILI